MNVNERIADLKAALDVIPQLPAADEYTRIHQVSDIVGRMSSLLVDQGAHTDIISSVLTLHAIHATAYAKGVPTEEAPTEGLEGVSQYLVASHPKNADDSIEESALLFAPFEKRLDVFAEQTAAQNGEENDFSGIFYRGNAKSSVEDQLENIVSNLVNKFDSYIEPAQILITMGQRMISNSAGQHRTAQYLAKTLAYELDHLTDPEGAAERDEQQRDAAIQEYELDRDAQKESSPRTQVANTPEDNFLKKAAEAFFQPGQCNYSDPFDPGDTNNDEPALASTPCPSFPNEPLFRDYQDAVWFGILNTMEISSRYFGERHDPRRPSFRIFDEEVGSIDTFTIEDVGLSTLHPDTQEAHEEWGIVFRNMTPRAILLLGTQPLKLESENASHAIVGWYLPPDSANSKPNRSWRIAFLVKDNNTYKFKSVPATCDTDGTAEPLELPSNQQAAGHDSEYVFNESAIVAESMGYQPVFLRRLERLFDGED